MVKKYLLTLFNELRYVSKFLYLPLYNTKCKTEAVQKLVNRDRNYFFLFFTTDLRIKAFSFRFSMKAAARTRILLGSRKPYYR